MVERWFHVVVGLTYRPGTEHGASLNYYEVDGLETAWFAVIDEGNPGVENSWDVLYRYGVWLVRWWHFEEMPRSRICAGLVHGVRWITFSVYARFVNVYFEMWWLIRMCGTLMFSSCFPVVPIVIGINVDRVGAMIHHLNKVSVISTNAKIQYSQGWI